MKLKLLIEDEFDDVVANPSSDDDQFGSCCRIQIKVVTFSPGEYDIRGEEDELPDKIIRHFTGKYPITLELTDTKVKSSHAIFAFEVHSHDEHTEDYFTWWLNRWCDLILDERYRVLITLLFPEGDAGIYRMNVD